MTRRVNFSPRWNPKKPLRDDPWLPELDIPNRVRVWAAVASLLGVGLAVGIVLLLFGGFR